MNDSDELNFTPLPPVTDQDLAMVRGVVNSNRLRMIKGLASVPLSEEFDFLGCDGRPIRIPDSVRHPGRKLEGAVQTAHMLRLTLTGDPKLALDPEGQLWACWEDSWRPTSDLLSLTEERDKGYDKFVRATLAKHPGLPVLQPGVRFANVGLLRGGEVVMPDDPRFNAPWAMSLDDEEFTRDRAILGLQAASTITTDMNDARMLCRVAAAPLMRDHLQYAYDLLGTGGNGKGCFLKALLDFYGPLGSTFSFADFAGIGKVSPTSYEQAGVPLTQRLLAHHCLEHVEHFVLHGEVLALVLFTPLHARQLVHTGIGVRTVFGEQKRLVGFGVHPLVHLVDEGLLGSDELIPILHIPAVIPVQADDIRELMALVFACGGHHQIGVGQRTMLRIERARVIEYLLEIRHGRLGCRVVGGVDEVPSAGGPRHSFRRRGQFRTRPPTQSSGRPARTACLRARSRPHTRACCSCDR